MSTNISAIKYMGMIMRAEELNITYVLNLVEIINNSFLSSKDVITILQQIFKNEKSGKILLATLALQYFVKNCNENFHQAANKESFQKSLLGLLKRQRGKMNIIKQLRSNSENWSRIQSKVLYLVQLWYDAFILQESLYPNIINTYKVLRKQNIVFPPRNVNQKSLLAIKTQSPIFDNIQSIAESDKEKFKKQLKSMGLNKLSEKFQQKYQKSKQTIVRKQINIDDINLKIAIIKSQDYQPNDVLKAIQQVKRTIDFGKVKPGEQKYWKDVKEAAEILIQEWEQKNSKYIQNKQQQYLQSKLNKKSSTLNKSTQLTSNIKREANWDLLGDDYTDEVGNKRQQKRQDDEWGDFAESQPTISSQVPDAKMNETNLLDLL